MVWVGPRWGGERPHVDNPVDDGNAQIAAVHWRLGERIMSTLCFPSKSAHSTGGKREKAVFD